MNKKILITIGVTFLLILLIIILISFFGPKPSLSITSSPKNIDIYIGDNQYETPVIIKNFRDKEITVYGSKAGYQLYTKKIKFQTGKKFDLNIVMEKILDEPPEGAPLSDTQESKIKNLPFENDHFRVSWDPEYSKYLIAPNIPFDMSQPPEDFLKQYWNDYKTYGIEALNWIKTQGINPTKDNIKWWGQELWPTDVSAPTI